MFEKYLAVILSSAHLVGDVFKDIPLTKIEDWSKRKALTTSHTVNRVVSLLRFYSSLNDGKKKRLLSLISVLGKSYDCTHIRLLQHLKHIDITSQKTDMNAMQIGVVLEIFHHLLKSESCIIKSEAM